MCQFWTGNRGPEVAYCQDLQEDAKTQGLVSGIAHVASACSGEAGFEDVTVVKNGVSLEIDLHSLAMNRSFFLRPIL